MVGMKGSKNFVLVFFVFLILSIILLLIPGSFLYPITSFFSKPAYSLLSKFPYFGVSSENQKLKEENNFLRTKLSNWQKLISENKALHDQFLTANPRSFDLLPSSVIGAPRFLPGLSSPDTYIINVGSRNNVKIGNAVVFKDNFVGRISKVTDYLSQVTLITNPNFKFTAKTTSGVLGIVKGEGNEDIVFDNVLLSEDLAKGDFVVTGADLQIDFSGLPSGLFIGKITSVEKNPSGLFQKGKIESLLDFSKIQTVFVVTGLPAQAGIK